MKIVIQRYVRYKQALHGRLRIDGEPVCDTLENAADCLSPGVYHLRMAKVKGIVRQCAIICDGDHPHLLAENGPRLEAANVPCLVAANGPYLLVGKSISIGEWHYLGFLIHCQDYFEPLMERVRKALRRHQNITVVILGMAAASRV